MEAREPREMFAKAQARDDYSLPWVQATEMGWTTEELRRQMDWRWKRSEGGWDELMPQLQGQPREGAV